MMDALPLAPQVSALLPVGAFHDLRWLLAFGDSWVAVLWQVAVALTFRTVISTVLIRAAWPAGRRPRWSTLFVRVGLANVAVLVAMSPWATFSFVAAVVSLSWPFVAGLAGAVLTGCLLLAHAGVSRRWWARLPPWRAAALVAAQFALSTLAALALGPSPGWAQWPIVAAAGLANGWCWHALVAACAETAPRRSLPRSLAVPVLTTSLLAAQLVVGAAVLSSFVFPVIPHHIYEQAPPRPGQRAVLLLQGFESDWDGGRPAVSFPGFYTAQYSYLGLGRHGPVAYRSIDTTASLPLLASRLAAQVDRLGRLTKRPVDIVAVSEGSLVVRAYVTDHPHRYLGTIVLSSPPVRPVRVSYPAPGKSGFGFAGGWETRLLLRLVTTEDPGSGLNPDMALARSMIAGAPLYRQRTLCPVPGAKVVALLPLTSAMVDPPGVPSGVPSAVEPGVHATLLHRSSVIAAVERILKGGAPPRPSGWAQAFQALRYASSAWSTPTLPLDLLGTAGSGAPQSARAPGHRGCPAPAGPAGPRLAAGSKR